MPLWVQPGRGGPGSFLFPVARDRLDGGLPAQQQEGGPREHTPLPRPSPRGLPGPSRLAVVLSPPLGSPPPPPPASGRARHRASGRTQAPGAGPRLGEPGRPLSWKTFWLFVYIAALPATWLSPRAANSGPATPSAPPAAALTIWWWWWLLGMLVSWKNVLRAVCGQTAAGGG